MNIPNYISTLYYKIEDKIRYTGKNTIDRVLEAGNNLFPQSPLEVALAGVPNTLRDNQYGPLGQYIPDDGIFQARANGNSNGKYRVKDIRREGYAGVVVVRSDGTRIILKRSEAREERDFDVYVSRVLSENDINPGRKVVKQITRELRQRR